jgi:hypothetical protein
MQSTPVKKAAHCCPETYHFIVLGHMVRGVSALTNPSMVPV